ncbi:hypothetical protein GF395_04180, partial [Candidatus Uhrbacteria bacterium]|nr:hypothetical protein [Candidatus Uhrbacteria bacterium]
MSRHLSLVRRLLKSGALLCMAFIAIVASATAAHAAEPIEGVHYTVLEGGSKVYIRKDVYTPAFAKKTNTDSFLLRMMNPDKTLAVCIRDSGWDWPRLQGNSVREIVAARASNENWNDCPEDRRYVHIVEKSTILMPEPVSSRFDDPSDASAESTPSQVSNDEPPASVDAPQKPEPSKPTPSVTPTAPTVASQRSEEEVTLLREELNSIKRKNVDLQHALDQKTTLLVAAEARQRTLHWQTKLYLGLGAVFLLGLVCFVGWKWHSEYRAHAETRKGIQTSDTFVTKANNDVIEAKEREREARAGRERAERELAKMREEQRQASSRTQLMETNFGENKRQLEAARASMKKAEAAAGNNRDICVGLIRQINAATGEEREIDERVHLGTLADEAGSRFAMFFREYHLATARI